MLHILNGVSQLMDRDCPEIDISFFICLRRVEYVWDAVGIDEDCVCILVVDGLITCKVLAQIEGPRVFIFEIGIRKGAVRNLYLIGRKRGEYGAGEGAVYSLLSDALRKDLKK
jgi:hypothetical protein